MQIRQYRDVASRMQIGFQTRDKTIDGRNVFLKSYFGIIPGAMKSEKVASLLP